MLRIHSVKGVIFALLLASGHSVDAGINDHEKSIEIEHGRKLSSYDGEGVYMYLGNGACRDESLPAYKVRKGTLDDCAQECKGNDECVGFEWRNDGYSGDDCEIFYNRPTRISPWNKYDCYAKHSCAGYFCDKMLNQIHIVMTHNSLSNRPGFGRNQPHGLGRQFRDGVRGFNLDLYPCTRKACDVLWTEHGRLNSYDPTDEIEDLVSELNKPQYRNEVIVIQLQNGGLEDRHVVYLTSLFGNLLIRDAYYYLGDTVGHDNTLKHAIELNQRVFLTTNRGPSFSGYFLHRSGYMIGENDYEWKNCRRPISRNRDEMPTGCRDDPETRCTHTTRVLNSNSMGLDHRPILLMNTFDCAASYANKKCRLLRNADRFKDSNNYEGFDNDYPNILMVDNYELGDRGVWEAQQCLRDDNVGGNGCETCGKMD